MVYPSFRRRGRRSRGKWPRSLGPVLVEARRTPCVRPSIIVALTAIALRRPAVPLRGRVKTFAKLLYEEFSNHGVDDSAASLSYYFVFSLFPFLFFLATPDRVSALRSSVGGANAGFRARDHAARGHVSHRPARQRSCQQAAAATPRAGAGSSPCTPPRGASTPCARPEPGLRRQGVAAVVEDRALAFGMTDRRRAAAAVRGGRRSSPAATRASGSRAIWTSAPSMSSSGAGLRWPVTALLMMSVRGDRLLLAARRRAGVQVHHARGRCWGRWSGSRRPGASAYAGHFGSYNVTYGSIGGVIILMTWFYITGFIFLMGGEINAILEHASPEGKATGARAAGEAPPPPSERPSAMPVGAADSAATAERWTAKKKDRRANLDRRPAGARIETS